MSRTTDHPIDPLFTERSSPRQYTGEPIDEATLFSLFEAARWAPSGGNSQPWRFIHARRGTPEWDRLFGFLGERNQAWAAGAAALVLVLSKTTRRRDGEPGPAPLRSHSFDAGAAWMSLAIQALRLGWRTRAMGGFDHARAREALGVPAHFQLEVIVAIGRAREGSDGDVPNGRRPVRELVAHGRFDFDEPA